MPSPIPKPSDRRQGRHRTDLGVVHGTGTARTVPPAPDGLLPATVADWDALWNDGLAVTINAATDLPSLRRLFKLRDDADRYDQAVSDEPLVQGSQGQSVLNPLLRQRDVLLVEIRQLEDRFGLNTRARLQLGVTLGDAHRSIDEMNRRYAEGGASVDSDPRVIDAPSCTA